MWKFDALEQKNKQQSLSINSTFWVSLGRLQTPSDVNFLGKQMSPVVMSCSEPSVGSRDADDKRRKQTVGTFLTMLIELGVI